MCGKNKVQDGKMSSKRFELFIETGVLCTYISSLAVALKHEHPNFIMVVKVLTDQCYLKHYW